MPNEPMKGRKLEVKDIRITGVEISGDCENWSEAKGMDTWGAVGGGLAHIIDLVTNGERVFIRAKYVDIYQNGTNGLPKTGATYEMKLLEIAPMRRVIEGELAKQQLPPAPEKK